MSRSLKLLAATVALAVVVSAAFVGAGAASSTSRTAKADDSLTISIPFPLTNFAVVWVAKAAGLFDKYGVNVNIMESTGANNLGLLVSGQADLSITATTQGMILAAQGQQVSHIGTFSRDPGSFIYGGPGITSLAALRALGDKCHIVTSSPGSQSYGYAVQYVKLASLGLQQCTVDQTPSTAVELAQFASGQDNAAVGPYSFFPLAEKAAGISGQNVLVNANLPGYRKTYDLPQFISGTFFGLKSDLQAKRSAVVKFLEAISAANKLVVPKNLTQLTNYLQPFPSFSANTFTANRNSLQYTISYIGMGSSLLPAKTVAADPNKLTNNPLWISKAGWDLSLQQYAKWGVPGLDVTAPVQSYGQAVDMSYLAAAVKAMQATSNK